MPQNTKLPRNKDTFIAALLSNPTISASAKAAGISEATALRWMQDPDFKASYGEAKQRMLDEVIRFLQQSMLGAVAVLRTTMLSNETRPAQRIMAARSILEFGLRAYELEDLEQRIARLEAERGEQGYAAFSASRNGH